MNLVTGATGILGSHVLLHLLREGKPVVAGKRAGSDLQKVRRLFECYGAEDLFHAIQWVNVDVLDYPALEELVQGVQTVYHCAGFVSFSPADRRQVFRLNEGGTRNVVNACLQAGNVRLCHVSTIGTISNSDLPELDESVFWKKSGLESDYAVSKYNAEREVWRGMEEGLDAVIVNPGVILSPVFWEQSSGRIFAKCFKGNAFYTGGSSAYISATDAARAMVCLVEGGQFGQRFILVEGNYDFRFILGRIQENFRRRPPFIQVPAPVLYAASAVGSVFSRLMGQPQVLTRALVNAACNRQKYLNSRVLAATGLALEPVAGVLDRVCAHYQTVSAGTSSKRPTKH